MTVRKILVTLAVGVGLATMSLLLPGGAPDAAQAELRAHHGTIYVAPGGVCGGMSPCFGTVQGAVDAVSDPGDVVKVAAGTYTGVTAREGVTQVVYINKTVTIQGGYTTDEWDTTDPEGNPTTLDAEGNGRALYITGEISPTIQGFRITGGDASGLGGDPIGPGPWGGERDVGGGVYVITATADLVDNVVFGNEGVWFGGGLYLAYSGSELFGNTIMDNLANYGAGVFLYEGHETVQSNSIVSNTARHSGGGLMLGRANAMVLRNQFAFNTAVWMGGGLEWSGGDATVSGNLIMSNTADYGGGVNIGYASGDLVNNVVDGNHAGVRGAGLHIVNSSPRLIHTTVAGNVGGDGSGIYVGDSPWGPASSTVELSNTILASHDVGITVAGANTVTVSSVLWHDTPITVSQSITAAVLLESEFVGDPAFSPDGYHLTGDSAAIDRGEKAGVTTDIDGEPRCVGVAPDLGADEYALSVYLPIVLKDWAP